MSLLKDIFSQIPKIYSGLFSRLKVFLGFPIRPRQLTLAVTYRCNSRCKMCKIWETSPKNELTLSEIGGIFSGGVLNNLKSVTLTGGEFSLRDDILEIAKLFIKNCPHLKSINFATNGLLPQRITKILYQCLEIAKDLKRALTFNVAVSLDGIELHQKLRGITRAYQLTIETVKSLKHLQVKYPNLKVNLQSVIVPENLSELNLLLEKSKELKTPILFTPLLPSEIYFKNLKNYQEFPRKDESTNFLGDFFQKANLSKVSSFGKSILHAYYYQDLMRIWRGGKRAIPCQAGLDWFFIDNLGNVYPCSVVTEDFKMGNIRESSLKKIWNSERAKKIRENLKSFPLCKKCTDACGLVINATSDTKFYLFLLKKFIKRLL